MKSAPAPQPSAPRGVVVVGAGVSGLAAAATLNARGRDVLVIEARKRIGGRVWTDRSWPGSPLDLGASWIHGVKDNPVAALAAQVGAKTMKTDPDSARAYDADGAPLSDVAVERIDARLKRVLARADRVRARIESAHEPDISLADGIARALADEPLAPDAARELAFAINAEIEQEYAADVADLSFLRWDDDAAPRGGDVLCVEGYDWLVRHLAKGLAVETDRVVTRIEHGDGGVRIATSRGDVRAEKAIVTLPIGVLKSGAVEFSPALPERTKTAIARLGTGVLNKTYLRFREAFWGKDKDWIQQVTREKGRWALWLNVAKYTGAPVVMGFNAGAFGARLEGWSDEAIVADAMQALRSMFGDKVPVPDATQITRWGIDPFARGSYSHLPPGASADDREALGHVVGDRLFFAGEATSRAQSATVRGAYESGLRAAEQILAGG